MNDAGVMAWCAALLLFGDLIGEGTAFREMLGSCGYSSIAALPCSSW